MTRQERSRKAARLVRAEQDRECSKIAPLIDEYEKYRTIPGPERNIATRALEHALAARGRFVLRRNITYRWDEASESIYRCHGRIGRPPALRPIDRRIEASYGRALDIPCSTTSSTPAPSGDLVGTGRRIRGISL
jgi:hypothetical protein